jgi:hypothetical protein
VILLKKLLSFTLLLAAITMTGGCLNQDKEESKDKEIVQAEKARRYASVYPSMYVRAIYSGFGGQMTLIGNNTWQRSGVISNYTSLINFDVYNNWSLYFGDSNNDGIAEQGGNTPLPKINTPYTVTFNEVTKKYTITEETHGCYGLFKSDNSNEVLGIADMMYLKGEVYDYSGKYAEGKIGVNAKFGTPNLIFSAKYGYSTIKVDALKAIPGEKYAKRYYSNSQINIPLSEVNNPAPTWPDVSVTITRVYFNSSYSQMYIKGTFNNWENTVTEYGVTRPSKMGLIANNVWCAEITTTAAGSFKFDRNGDWSENYGDNNNDKYGDRNGSNIAIPSAGVWKVTFNETTKQYTIEKIN